VAGGVGTVLTGRWAPHARHRSDESTGTEPGELRQAALKPSPFVDDPDEVGTLCREVMCRVEAMVDSGSGLGRGPRVLPLSAARLRLNQFRRHLEGCRER